MNDTTAENLVWKTALSNNKADRIKYAKQLIAHIREAKYRSDNKTIAVDDMVEKLTIAAQQIKYYKDKCFIFEKHYKGDKNENI